MNLILASLKGRRAFQYGEKEADEVVMSHSLKIKNSDIT